MYIAECINCGKLFRAIKKPEKCPDCDSTRIKIKAHITVITKFDYLKD